MRIIDLHCDTLYKRAVHDVLLDSNENEVLITDDENRRKLQCYAIWLPDSLSGSEAEVLTIKAAGFLKKECERLNIRLISDFNGLEAAFEASSNSACLTIENSLALNGKLENVREFAKLGARMMTLTWNALNPVGGGAEDAAGTGLTSFGEEVVREMEKYNMIVDISHACEKLFYDVAQVAKRPFVASHSNSYSITGHVRNLKDEQFKIIAECGGVVGLNFHNAFLNTNPEKACMSDILRHTEHFLSLGGENTLCFGSDFDGGVLPSDIQNSAVYDNIYEMFLQNNYSEELIRKIFFKNALNFFENFDNQRIM